MKTTEYWSKRNTTVKRGWGQLQTQHQALILSQGRYDYNLPVIKSTKPAPNALGTSWSVLLNVYYHKVYHIRTVTHILCLYYAFNDVNWWGIYRHARGDFPVSAIECVLS